MQQGKFVVAWLSSTWAGAAIAAVDKSSDAYQRGTIFGKIFLLIFALLVIRKLFFSSKR